MTNSNISQQLAERYLPAIKKRETREKLSTDLLSFTKRKFLENRETFIVNEHHEQIAEALEKVRRGEIQNLVINVPPRYGKTELAVICWIAQCLAANPKAKFIHLSYSDDLALDNSAKAREIINSDWYQSYWPLKLKDDADSKKKWYTAEGGGLYATAAGGAITGFGAGSTEQPDDGLFYGAIIIDDPHKVEDALRELERKKVCDRLNSTIKSRRNSRQTPIIIIMQRLHEDDLSGYVLRGGMEEKFHHLKLAAIKPDGTALWPFKHTVEELLREKAADSFTFSGQMMQEPYPEDGTFFKKEWFKRYRAGDEPKSLIKYGASDFAVSEGRGDFTEQAIAGFDHKEDLWFVDWWTGQATSDVWIDAQIELARNHEPMIWVAEGGVIRRSVEPFLLKSQQTKNCYYRLEWLTSNKDKAANARTFQALCSQGKVWIPMTPWGDDLIAQLLQFPAGKYDDKVDVCGLLGRILDQTFAPSEIRVEETTPKDSYGLSEETEDEWKVV